VVEVAPTCLVGTRPTGTIHGSPHAYDRDIPLVFMGPPASLDIAPTLARWLEIAISEDLDGRTLPLSGAAVTSTPAVGSAEGAVE
jgi:hypothetical protein